MSKYERTIVEQIQLISRVAGVSNSITDCAPEFEEGTWNGNSLSLLASKEWGTEEGEEGQEELSLWVLLLLVSKAVFYDKVVSEKLETNLANKGEIVIVRIMSVSIG